MTDQIFILVLAVTLAFAFGVWIGNDQAKRQTKRKLRQERFDEWIGEPPPFGMEPKLSRYGNFMPVDTGKELDPTKPPPFQIGVQPDRKWPR